MDSFSEAVMKEIISRVGNCKNHVQQVFQECVGVCLLVCSVLMSVCMRLESVRVYVHVSMDV